jgi:hypothetical protein
MQNGSGTIRKRQPAKLISLAATKGVLIRGVAVCLLLGFSKNRPLQAANPMSASVGYYV